MTTFGLLMFNLDETPGIVRNAACMRSLVDEIVVIDNSSPESHRALVSAVEPYGAKVYRALPLGYADALRAFGVSQVSADYVLQLDADEELSPRLAEDLRRLTDHDAYVVPRYEIGLRSYTYHMRLFRRAAARFAGRSYDFPEVHGTVGYLPREWSILHHARFDTYFSDKSRARRYFTVESYERPFTPGYLAEAFSLRIGSRSVRLPFLPTDPDRPLSPAAIQAAVEVEFFRDLLMGRGSRAARFNRRYAQGKAAFIRGLSPSDRARISAIAREMRAAGGLYPYLNLSDPAYVGRLTSSFAWDRAGIEVYEELLRYRHERGVPADRVSPPPSRAEDLRPAGGSGRLGMSIVIPTHDRPDRLRALLGSIRAAASPVVESIIIVDDSVSPSDPVGEFPDLPVTHLTLVPRAFISRAKNLGWRAAQSPFVFFIDDDNVVTRDTLEKPLAVMAGSAEIGALVPSVLYKERPDLVWVYATPLAPGRWGHTLLGRNRPRDPALEGRLYDTDALPNAAFVRREALEEIGGFSEALEVNSSADAALRLKAKGWRVLAYSGAFIHHDVEPPGRAGYWARHGAADPDRVFHEVRDWFVVMRTLHATESLFPLRATWHALGFMLPNGMVYLVRGGPRGRRAFRQLVRGYLNGLRVSAGTLAERGASGAVRTPLIATPRAPSRTSDRRR